MLVKEFDIKDNHVMDGAEIKAHRSISEQATALSQTTDNTFINIHNSRERAECILNIIGEYAPWLSRY